MDKNLISVIVTAYNRKEFILDALKSAVNQTLNKKYFEIIVIKNFEDELIDNFINKNNIKNIIMNGTVGEYLYKGIEESRGEIICFLDDDDLFFTNKLEYINYIFSKDKVLGYFHNDALNISPEGERLKKIQKNNIDFNISSISIRKNIIDKQLLKKIWTAPDTLLYIFGLESNKRIINSNKKLNFYRIHNNNTTTNIKWFKEYKSQLENFNSLSMNKRVRQLLKRHILMVNIVIKLTEKNGISIRDGIYYFTFLFINLQKSLIIMLVKNIFGKYINHP